MPTMIWRQVDRRVKKPAQGGLETGMDSCLRRNDRKKGRNDGKGRRDDRAGAGLALTEEV